MSVSKASVFYALNCRRPCLLLGRYLRWAVALALPLGMPAATAAGASPTAEPSAKAVEDPLLRLRDRLTEKLGAKAGQAQVGAAAVPVMQVPAQPSGEIQVKADGMQRAGAATAQRQSSAKSPKAQAASAAAEALAGWSYSGSQGPEHWGKLKPEYQLCATGQRQSPIDIRDGFAVDLEPIRFDYRAGPFWVRRGANALEMRFDAGSAVEVGGQRYLLKGLSLRLPAEERIHGQGFDMGIQLHHVAESGALLTLAVLLARGEPHPVVQALLNHLPLESGLESPGRAGLDPSTVLPSSRAYFTYMGSLTTPPCTEGVQWVVMQQPLSVSPAQMAMVARLLTANARPQQALAGRIVKQSP